MATIYLFRHGQTDFNLEKKFTGWLQSQLTDLGRQQAQILADLLKDKHIDTAYTSRLVRCQDTLKIVLQYHPECKETVIDDRIIERSYGDLAGGSHADAIAKYGQEQFDKWHRGWDDRPPGGENFVDVQSRVGSLIDDLRSKYHDQNINIAISGSGNSIRLFRKIMENATIEDCVTWTIPYDQYFEYTI